MITAYYLNSTVHIEITLLSLKNIIKNKTNKKKERKERKTKEHYAATIHLNKTRETKIKQ